MKIGYVLLACFGSMLIAIWFTNTPGGGFIMSMPGTRAFAIVLMVFVGGPACLIGFLLALFGFVREGRRRRFEIPVVVYGVCLGVCAFAYLRHFA